MAEGQRMTYATLMELSQQPIEEWPDDLRESCAGVRWHEIRYRQDHHSWISSINELHPYAKKIVDLVSPFFPEEGDLHVTGSWAGGWWTNPEEGPEDKLQIRKLVGKNPTSDIDFWTAKTPKDKALDILKPLGRKHDFQVSWVEWWGGAVPVMGDKVRVCNSLERRINYQAPGCIGLENVL